jgi:predicted nuclease of predicted toxin-antitoxin system
VKLLLDENLSVRLVGLLSDVYPGLEHVQNVGLGGTDDVRVWTYAKANGLTIVSKDSDFADLSVLEGAPPKVVWVWLGNCTMNSIATLLGKSVGAMGQFIDGEETCLMLGRR